MDYLMDKYLFDNLPIEVSPETKKEWGQRALHLVQVFDWICKYQEPSKIYENHTSFLFGELLFFLLAALTFTHAWRHGTRYLLVWFGILIHALNVENLCYWIPDMDNFWQAQGILTFFGARAPLYILVGIYHMFDYTAFVMASRLHLPWWAYGPAVGLGAVMLDMPYDIMGIKLVWWTWHDTDPNIYDRMNWVPWNSYYFHASFACSFTWLLMASRHYLVEREYDWKKLPREILCIFIAGMGAFWLGTIQFALLYHPLHDIFKVHSEYTTMIFLSFYAVIVFIADRRNQNRAARTGNPYWFDELACAIVIEYLFFMIAVLISDPENIVSDGLHQAIGPCNETQKVQTPTGLVLQKNKYFCVDNYDEKYIDFHCVPGGAPQQQEPGVPLEWYAVCGTPYENRAEYIFLIWGICILFSLIWFQVAARSGETPVDMIKIYRRRSPKAEGDKATGSSKKVFSLFTIPSMIYDYIVEPWTGYDILIYPLCEKANEEDHQMTFPSSGPIVATPKSARQRLGKPRILIEEKPRYELTDTPKYSRRQDSYHQLPMSDNSSTKKAGILEYHNHNGMHNRKQNNHQ